ncbi:MAG: hypothetical protein Ct9H300mP1_26550 [Planctomycetaceae bacterium]|nr:MAG: hypothetical protein Ct9H300mP1_26550 [Planctomycetaceae bacterium]
MMLDFGTKRTRVDQLMAKAAEGWPTGAKKTQVDAGGVSITDFELPLPPPDPNAAEAAPRFPSRCPESAGSSRTPRWSSATAPKPAIGHRPLGRQALLDFASNPSIANRRKGTGDGANRSSSGSSTRSR